MIKSVMLVADTPKPEDLVIRHFEVYLKLLRWVSAHERWRRGPGAGLALMEGDIPARTDPQ